ncbi:MAG: hypothetical protein Fur005_40600 [Roseiflexaceae bacterium]
MKRLNLAFTDLLYIQVRTNQFSVRNISTQQEQVFFATNAFTTQRLLIGDFDAAEQTLTLALKALSRRYVLWRPVAVIHPLELIEGGLSPVEQIVLRDVVLNARARKSLVWVGHLLSDDEVRTMIEAAL